MRRYREGILAAIRLGLTNARIEGLRNKIRRFPTTARDSTHQALISLIYLCCARITITPPQK